MNKLIIVAHPHPQGFSHRIADTYQRISIDQWHDVKVINLYDPERKQDYMMVDAHNKTLPDDKQQKIQSLITRANELVFCFPLRRFDCPAIMKNFLDVNMSSGFAFRYKKWSLTPHKLLQGKTARVFLTAGSPNRVLWTIWLGMRVFRYIWRMGYCGVNLKSFTTFGKLPAKRQEHQRKKLLNIVSSLARR